MEALHEDEEPGADILAGLLEALHCGGLVDVRVGELVLLHAGVGEVALALVEPAGRKWRVGEEPEAEDSYKGGDGTLNDEEPRRITSVPGPFDVSSSLLGSPPVVLQTYRTGRGGLGPLPSPARDTACAVQAREDTGGNKTRKARSQDLSAIQHGNASSHLCLVKVRTHSEGTHCHLEDVPLRV